MKSQRVLCQKSQKLRVSQVRYQHQLAPHKRLHKLPFKLSELLLEVLIRFRGLRGVRSAGSVIVDNHIFPLSNITCITNTLY